MTTIKIPVRTVYDNSNNPLGLAEFQVGEVVGIAQGGTSANTVANARINLEVDNANIRGLFSASGDLSYNSSTGVFSFTNDPGDIESVTAGNGLTGGGTSGNVTLDVVGGFGITVNADNIEVDKSQINALARTSITVGGAATYDNTTGNIYVTGGVTAVAGATGAVSNAQILAGLQQTGYLTTANIAEVSNLYYTVDRANTAIDNRVNKSFIDNLNVDADTLDGQDGTYFLDWTNTTNKPDPVVNVTLTGDVTGSAQATLADVTSNTITIATTIQPNSVALGTDTTGAYVANLVAGTGVTLTGLADEGATPTIAIGQAVATNSDVQFAKVNTSSQVRITDATESTGVGTGALIVNGGASFGGNVNISGNLNVTGNVVTFSANDLILTDPMIFLADGNSGDVLDVGFVGHYTNPDLAHTGLVRDASDGIYKLFSNVVPNPTTTVDFTNAIYSTLKLGNVNSDTGSFSGNVFTGNITSGRGKFTSSEVGTVVSGTWNGSSISTTYTDAKVTSVANQTGAISNAQLQDAVLLATGNILPASDNVYSIGSETLRYKDLYLSGNSLYLANLILRDNGTTLQIFRGANSIFEAESSPGFVDSSITIWPGSEGDSDYGSGEAFVGENAIISDAFGVQLGSVFSMMEPKGRTDSYDLAVLT